MFISSISHHFKRFSKIALTVVHDLPPSLLPDETPQNRWPFFQTSDAYVFVKRMTPYDTAKTRYSYAIAIVNYADHPIVIF